MKSRKICVFIFGVILLFILGCKNSSIKKGKAEPELLTSGYLPKITEGFKLLSYTKYSEHLNNDRYSDSCTNWNLNEKQITEGIQLCEPISSHEFMNLFNVLPCEIRGEMSTKGNIIYQYKLNAGGFLQLFNKDTTYYFGCFNQLGSSYFLLLADKP